MTTNNTLPAHLRDRYRLTREMKGGPVFAFPTFGLGKVDFSKLTAQQAEALLAHRWPGICRVEKTDAPTVPPAEATDTDTDTPELPTTLTPQAGGRSGDRRR
jgi:hypothetical protein